MARGKLKSFCRLCGKRVSSRVRRWCLDEPHDYAGNVYCFEHQRRFAGVLRTSTAT